MVKRGLSSTMNANDVLTALSRTEIERKGRWSSLGRSMASLALLVGVLIPVWRVCTGSLESSVTLPAAIPSRLAVTITALVVVLVWLVGWRCAELVRSSRAPRVLVLASTVAVGLLTLSGLVTLGLLARRFVAAGGPGGPNGAPLLTTGWWSVSWIAGGSLVVALLLALVSSPGLWWRLRDRQAAPRWAGLSRTDRRPLPSLRAWGVSRFTPQEWARWRSALDRDEVMTDPRPRPDTVICCSGGGIRSASFCLGGLQELQSSGIYDRSDAVVGVSGGGYIAAAMHVLRGRAPAQSAKVLQPIRPSAFALKSIEMRWLRRHTRYLFDSVRMATLAALSILFGMVVNLFWCALVLGSVAWWLGWLFNAAGGLRGWATLDAVGGQYEDGWAGLSRIWLVPVAGVAAFAIERVGSRLHTPSVAVREFLRSAAVGLVWAGLALSALLLGLPQLMAWLHDTAAVSGYAWARLASIAGLVPNEVCDLAVAQAKALGEGAACGVPDAAQLTVVDTSATLSAQKTAGVSLATVIAAVVAVVRSGLAKLPAEGSSAAKTLAAEVGAKIKHVLLPWLGLFVIVVAALITLMSWVARLVNHPAGLARWDIVAFFAITAVVLRIFTDANWTSLHPFYRERLSYAFLQERTNGTSQPLPYKEMLRFSASRPTDGGPELVSCAVANVNDLEFVPANRGCVPFVFDRHLIGLTDRAFPADARQLSSATYEFAADFRLREATIPAAMAMSGAAFSPLVGREQKQVAPYRLIMALANARLGVWLPNPLWVDPVRQTRRMISMRVADAASRCEQLPAGERNHLLDGLPDRDLRWLSSLTGPDTPELGRLLREVCSGSPSQVRVDRRRRAGRLLQEMVRSVADQPGPFRLVKEGLGRTSVKERRLYITDGGHYDNLGLVEALRRRPRTIYVLDASNDPPNSFQALGQAIATARMDLDCELQLDPSAMVAGDDGTAEVAFSTGTARYADGRTATVHLVKALRLAGMTWDNEAYRRQNPHFPRTSTSDQFYNEFDFEAYRQLGAQATRSLLLALTAETNHVATNGSRPAAQPKAVAPVGT